MGTNTPNISIYIPAVGETDYFQAFSDGMTNIDNHAHTGAPLGGAAVLTTVDGTALSSAVPAVNPLWPSRCKFSAYLSATVPNATGNATPYTVLYNTTINNVGAAFNTGTGIFTAPVTGNYLFCASVVLTGIGVGHTAMLSALIMTTQSFVFGAQNPVPIVVGGEISTNISQVVQLTAGQTARVVVTVYNSTQTVNVFSGGLANPGTTFQGYLLG